MKINNFSEAMTELQKFVPPPFSSKTVYTLKRIQAFMDYLGNPQDQVRVIHVAGTSGKTSTAYYCAGLLQAAGYKVGLTVSPHIMTINERVQINGQPLPETEFCDGLNEFLSVAEASGIALTYFELLVAYAYWQFARHQVDFAVVEVGLGGLLDGTNTISRADKVCVITDIGLDHQNVLGNTLPEIATQKAGIIQSGNDVYMYEQSAEIMARVQVRAAKVGAQLDALDDNGTYGLTLFQNRNFGLALHVTQAATSRVFDTSIIEHAKRTLVPGRFEVFKVGESTVILDGAHNSQKLTAFADSFKEQYGEHKAHTILTLVSGNDQRIEPVVRAVADFSRSITVADFVTSQDSVRQAVPAMTIQKVLDIINYDKPFSVSESSLQALQSALAAGQPLIVLVGSFYSLVEPRAWLYEQAGTKS